MCPRLQVGAAEILPLCKSLAFASESTLAAARQQHLIQLHIAHAQHLLYGDGGARSPVSLCESWAALGNAKALAEEVTNRKDESCDADWCRSAEEQVPCSLAQSLGPGACCASYIYIMTS